MATGSLRLATQFVEQKLDNGDDCYTPAGAVQRGKRVDLSVSGSKWLLVLQGLTRLGLDVVVSEGLCSPSVIVRRDWVRTMGQFTVRGDPVA
jgi:hypothetical protein